MLSKIDINNWMNEEAATLQGRENGGNGASISGLRSHDKDRITHGCLGDESPHIGPISISTLKPYAANAQGITDISWKVLAYPRLQVHRVIQIGMGQHFATDPVTLAIPKHIMHLCRFGTFHFTLSYFFAAT